MGILYFEAVARVAVRLAPLMAGARRVHQRAGSSGLGRHHQDILAGAHRTGRDAMPVVVWSIRPATHRAARMRKMKGAAA
jgi:hypothetical protein